MKEDSRTQVLLVDVLVFRVRDVDGDLGLLGRLVPLEEEAERDVVRVRRELPEERGALVVRRHAHRHRLAVTNLDY